MIRQETISEFHTISRHVIFQPDNGTRYEVVFTEMDEDTHLMIWLNRGCGRPRLCFPFRRSSGWLVYTYFQEKMDGLNDQDSAALLSLIYEVTGRSVVLPPGMDANGNFIDSDESIILGDPRLEESA